MTTPQDSPRPDHEDLQLTAYALGELEGDAFAEQRAAVEARLTQDPALREQLAAIAQLAQQLEQGYERAADPGLPDTALHALPHAASATPTPTPPQLKSANPPAVAQTHTAQPANPLARLLPYAAVAACAAGATALGFIALQGPGSANTPAASPPDVVVTDPPAEADDDPSAVAAGPDDAPDGPGHTDAPPEPALTAHERMTQALETHVSVNYRNTPLEQVFADLREQLGANVTIDWVALETPGIDPFTGVTLRLDDVPLRTVLDYTLQTISAGAIDDEKAGYRVGNESLEITTLVELRSQTEVRVYDISQMLGPSESLLAQFESRLVRMASANRRGFGGGGGLFGDDRDGRDSFTFGIVLQKATTASPTDRLNAPPPGPRIEIGPALPATPHTPRLAEAHPPPHINSGGSNAPGRQGGAALFGDDSDDEFDDTVLREELVEEAIYLIQDIVGNPDEWLDEDSTIFERGGALIIKTTPENHEQIASLLAMLDRTKRPASDVEGLAEDPDRIAELAALFAHDLEQRLVEVREREARRQAIALWNEQFANVHDNVFLPTDQNPLSTFSVDVDTASYTIARRTLLQEPGLFNEARLPGPDTIRIEEFINYFQYEYEAPLAPLGQLDEGVLTTAALERLEARDASFTPFATHVEVTDCPWAQGHQLVRIGIKGMEVTFEDRPAAHLTFLLDVSGSMNNADKLPLVKDAMVMLLDQLRDDDRVSIVVYAGASGSVIEGVSAVDYERIRDAIDGLESSGGTNGAAGIELAYELAERYYIPGGVNRVVLCTDGDFNIGISGTDALVELIEDKANPDAPIGGGPAPAVYLSVFGVGSGNLNDAMMERLTNAGNGNYNYIDSVDEAARALSDQVNGTLVTIAKDVKLQVEFNPAQVSAYRLIGYENRMLADEDFNDDTVDAGDIGAGHTVTALYQIVPTLDATQPAPDAQADDGDTRDIDPLRYQRPSVLTDAAALPELLTVALRYKPVDAAATQGTSRRIAVHVPAGAVAFDQASEDTRFAAAVAALGMALRGSPHRGSADLSWVVATADAAREHDPHGHRAEFINVAEQARRILEPDDE